MERHVPELYYWVRPQRGAAPVTPRSILAVVPGFLGSCSNCRLTSVRVARTQTAYHEFASRLRVAVGAGETENATRYGGLFGRLCANRTAD